MPYESRLEHKRELCDLRRVPPDAKDPRLCRPPRNGIVGHLREPPDKVRTHTYTPTPPRTVTSAGLVPSPGKGGTLWPLILAPPPPPRRCPTWGSGMSCRRTRACLSRGRRSTLLVSGVQGWGGSGGDTHRDGRHRDEPLALTPPPVPAACGSLTRTLDSGIGTFPPPDYGGVPAKSTPKPRGRPEPLPGAVPARPPAITKVPRKARTLEREVPSAEELLVAGKHRSAPACRPPAPPGPHGHRAAPQGQCRAWGVRGPADGARFASTLVQNAMGAWQLLGMAGGMGGLQAGTDTPPSRPPIFVADAGDDAGKPRRVQQSKNWTFPNAKACGTADPFLCPPTGLEGLHRPTLVRMGGQGGGCGTTPVVELALAGSGGGTVTPPPTMLSHPGAHVQLSGASGGVPGGPPAAAPHPECQQQPNAQRLGCGGRGQHGGPVAGRGARPPRAGALRVAQRFPLRQPLLLRQPGLSPPGRTRTSSAPPPTPSRCPPLPQSGGTAQGGGGPHALSPPPHPALSHGAIAVYSPHRRVFNSIKPPPRPPRFIYTCYCAAAVVSASAASCPREGGREGAERFESERFIESSRCTKRRRRDGESSESQHLRPRRTARPARSLFFSILFLGTGC